MISSKTEVLILLADFARLQQQRERFHSAEDNEGLTRKRAVKAKYSKAYGKLQHDIEACDRWTKWVD